MPSSLDWLTSRHPLHYRIHFVMPCLTFALTDSAWCAGLALFLTDFQSIINEVILSFFITWSLWYCLAVMGVVLICLLFLLIICPLFVTLIQHNLSMWLALPLSITVPWVHGLASSCQTNLHCRSYRNNYGFFESNIAHNSFVLPYLFCHTMGHCHNL